MQTDLARAHHVRISGNGSQPILFAHGLGCDQHMWRFVAPAFEEQFKVVLFDHMGSGRSDLSLYNKEKYNSLQGYAADVVALCRFLDLEKVIFVGHSVSSMIGLHAAIEAPELFASLVMVAPSPCYLNDGEYRGGFERHEIDQLLTMIGQNSEEWAAFFAPQVVGPENSPELVSELAERFCNSEPAVLQQFARVTFCSDSRGDLGRLTVPSLLLQCADDILAPPQVGAYLNQQLFGSTLQLLKATGHCPHLSAPEETMSAIRQFLGVYAKATPVLASP